jgi:predicted glycosyltransferase
VRVWVDLANSPHVLVLGPIIERLRGEGEQVLLTARDHAQTVELARARWPEVQILGQRSPRGVLAKGRGIAERALALRRFAGAADVDVAFSHGSYAQLIAARALGIPSITMMDYEYQPANHLSFRLASRVIVPDAFPAAALRQFGARARKIVRYPGFKEQLYVAQTQVDGAVLDRLGLDQDRVIAVFRPPPDGALYHRVSNERFEELLAAARTSPNVRPVLLPRGPEQRARYEPFGEVVVPGEAVDSLSLLALADLMVGGGGTMTRESALLGTRTYTVFAGRLAAVDAALIREGLLIDARSAVEPRFEKRPDLSNQTAVHRAGEILEIVVDALRSIFRPAGRGRRGPTCRGAA